MELSTILIISLAELHERCRPSSNLLDNEDVDTFIREAQNLDVKRQIGDALLIDVKKYIEGSGYSREYDELLNGTTWSIPENTCGGQGEFEMSGLKTAVAYYTYARMIKLKYADMTRSGMMSHNDQYGTRLSSTHLKQMEMDARTAADSYMLECLKYLQYNSAEYPKFGRRRAVQRNNINFRIIGN